MKAQGVGALAAQARRRQQGERAAVDATGQVLARFVLSDEAAVRRCVARHARLVATLGRLRERIELEFGRDCCVGLCVVQVVAGVEPAPGLLVMVRATWGGAHALGCYERVLAWWRRRTPRVERERIALGLVPGAEPANDNAG